MPRRKPAPRPSGNLAFITSTNLEKPDEVTRKAIRSHVMLGKNAGKTAAGRSARPAPLPSPPDSDEDTPESGTADDASTIRAFHSTSPPESLALSPVSRRFSDFASTLTLAEDAGYDSIAPILRWSKIAKQLLFVLEPCIFFERRAEEWISPLGTDPAYLHCISFGAQYFFDAASQQTIFQMTDTTTKDAQLAPLGKKAMAHYVHGLWLLRNRLGDASDPLQSANSTVAAILALTTYAMAIRDYGLARQHLYGVRRIIELRGGICTFAGSEKLLVEILRSDLGLALTTGKLTQLIDVGSTTAVIGNHSLLDAPRLEPMMVLFGLPVAKPPETVVSQGSGDRLLQRWQILQDFCTLINFGFNTAQKIEMRTFLHVMVYAMYGMMDMVTLEGHLTGPLGLAVMAFASSIFLQWRTIGVPYTHFVQLYRGWLSSSQAAQMDPELKLWCVMIGAVAVMTVEDDVWLRAALQEACADCNVHDWPQCRGVLKSFLWINSVHEHTASNVFRRLMVAEE